jgi:hypothetical protein
MTGVIFLYREETRQGVMSYLYRESIKETLDGGIGIDHALMPCRVAMGKGAGD